MKKFVLWIGMFVATGLVHAQTDWTRVNNPNDDNLFTSPAKAQDGALYAGVKGLGMHRSDDGGSTWTAITDGQYNEDWSNAEPLGFAEGVVFSGVYNRSYRSEDKGATWININFNPDDISHIFAYDGSVFMLNTDGYIRRSDDGGATWAEKINGLPSPDDQNPNRYHTYTVMGNTIFVGEYGGQLYKTTDKGENWTEVGSKNRHTPFITAVGNTLVASHPVAAILMCMFQMTKEKAGQK